MSEILVSYGYVAAPCVRGSALLALRACNAGRSDDPSLQPIVELLHVLTKQEGGRHTPFGSGYTPQLFFGATDVTATLRCGDTLINPGDRAQVDFDLIRAIAVEPGMRFAMREGGRTVGAGVVVAVD